MNFPSKRQKTGNVFISTPEHSIESGDELFSIGLSHIEERESVVHEEKDDETNSSYCSSLSLADIQLDEGSFTSYSNLTLISDDLPVIDSESSITIGNIPISKLPKIYKPINGDSLYAEVVNNPDNLDVIIDQYLLINFGENDDNVIKRILQFFLDVAGFQKFSVNPYYNSNDAVNSLKQIIQLLESYPIIEQHEHLAKEHFLLAGTRNGTVNILQNVIYKFVDKLIYHAHIRGIFYNNKFYCHIIQFLRLISTSRLLTLKQTAVIISNKILTSVIMIWNDIVNDQNIPPDELKFKLNLLREMIIVLYSIFQKNCLISYIRAYQMKIECAREVKTWIKYFPKMFIVDFESIHKIKMLTIDPHKDVRLEALNTLENLFSTAHIFKILKPKLSNLMETISHRFWDTEISVVSKAVEIFKVFLDICPKDIQPTHFMSLSELLFDQYAPNGIAASTFFVKHYEKIAPLPEDGLISITKLYINRSKGDCIRQVIVESFLYTYKPMQNWNLFSQLILESQIDESLIVGLAEIFSEAVDQSINGKSSVMRTMSKTVITDGSVSADVAKELPRLQKILATMSNPTILNEVFRIIILAFPRGQKIDSRIYDLIWNSIRVFYNFLFDETLLATISAFINHFCNIRSRSQMRQEQADAFIEGNVQELKNVLSKPDNTIYLKIKRVELLWQYFKLNHLLSFKNLCNGLKLADVNTTLSFLNCIKWYLIWNLKSLIETFLNLDDTTKESRLNRFQTMINTFNFEIFSLMKNSETLISNSLKALSILCEAYKEVFKIVQNLNTQTFGAEQLFPKITNEDDQQYLIIFLEKKILPNQQITLSERRRHFLNYVTLTTMGVLPIDQLSNVFKYYHKYYDDYGVIIEDTVDKIERKTSNTEIIDMITYTVISVFESILNKYTVVDKRTEEFKEFQLLIRRFCDLKYFHKTQFSLCQLVCILINYAFHQDSNLPILYAVTETFRFITSSEDRKKILTHYTEKRKLRMDLQKDDIILKFQTELKQGFRKLNRFDTSKKNHTERNKNKKIQRNLNKDKKTNKETTASKNNGKKTSESDSCNDDDMTIQDSDNENEQNMSNLTT